MKDSALVKHINEQLAPLGVEVEYMQIPRAEESTKLTSWLASGDAPDVLIVYDASVFYRYAAQGGLRPLDDLLDEYGQNIKVNNAVALEQAGVLDGVRYGIPAIRTAKGGANMSIRKDWLDALGMEVPTTIEELTEVLRAFRDQDPGGIGKENVIPWGLPSLAGGQASFFYGPMTAFGVNSDGPGPNGIYMPSGNIVNGEFVSGFSTEEGKNYFRWMNQMYQEGILPKEFATDLNSQNFNQEFANGHIGFFDANNPAQNQNINVRKTAPDATYVTVPPLERPDGSRMIGQNAQFGMFIFIPKTTPDDEAAAVIKFLNWMATEEGVRTVNWGIEGEHYVMENGVRVVPDPDKNKQELWMLSAGDMSIIQQGIALPEDKEGLMQWYSTNASLPTKELQEEFVDSLISFNKMFDDYGVFYPFVYLERPLDQQIGSSIGTYLQEGISKLIIAQDFDKEYDNLIKGWEQLGGRDWDKEVTETLKKQGDL